MINEVDLPTGAPEWGTGAGCLVMGGLIAALPLGYFWSAKAGWLTLAVIAIMSLSTAISSGKEARAKAEQEATRAKAERERWDFLCDRWGDEVAQKVLDHEIWQGQTLDMLIEAMGPPAAIDEKVLKTKTTHTFKYVPGPRGAYRLKVKLDDGICQRG